METLFDTWSQDTGKERSSIILDGSGSVNDTTQNLIDNWFNTPVISDPVDNTVPSGSFWNNLTGYLQPVVSAVGNTADYIFGGAKADALSMKSQGLTTGSDVIKHISNQATTPITNAISFVKSGLFKAIIFIVIAVILFFMAQGFLSKKGAALA